MTYLLSPENPSGQDIIKQQNGKLNNKSATICQNTIKVIAQNDFRQVLYNIDIFIYLEKYHNFNTIFLTHIRISETYQKTFYV